MCEKYEKIPVDENRIQINIQLNFTTLFDPLLLNRIKLGSLNHFFTILTNLQISFKEKFYTFCERCNLYYLILLLIDIESSL